MKLDARAKRFLIQFEQSAKVGGGVGIVFGVFMRPDKNSVESRSVTPYFFAKVNGRSHMAQSFGTVQRAFRCTGSEKLDSFEMTHLANCLRKHIVATMYTSSTPDGANRSAKP